MKPIADVSGKSIVELVSLAGRNAVVTGGGRGLGKAIAARLAEAGANVLVADRLTQLAEDAAVDIGQRFNIHSIGTFMDVADSPTITSAAELAIEKFGHIDIWINNAGIFPCVPLEEMTDELWDDVLAINTRGTFAGSREAARHMRAAGKGGVIVNVASTAAFKGVAPGLGAYVASKHAVRGLTRQLALELAPSAIRVLGVAPTFCVTEGNLLAMDSANPEHAQEIAAMISSPLGRVGAPDDVARAVLFCATDMANFMTGSTLLVDAGETI